METLEQKMDKLELRLQHFELLLMRKIMEKENEEKRPASHTLGE